MIHVCYENFNSRSKLNLSFMCIIVKMGGAHSRAKRAERKLRKVHMKDAMCKLSDSLHINYALDYTSQRDGDLCITSHRTFEDYEKAVDINMHLERLIQFSNYQQYRPSAPSRGYYRGPFNRVECVAQDVAPHLRSNISTCDRPHMDLYEYLHNLLADEPENPDIPYCIAQLVPILFALVFIETAFNGADGEQSGSSFHPDDCVIGVRHYICWSHTVNGSDTIVASKCSDTSIEIQTGGFEIHKVYVCETKGETGGTPVFASPFSLMFENILKFYASFTANYDTYAHPAKQYIHEFFQALVCIYYPYLGKNGSLRLSCPFPHFRNEYVKGSSELSFVTPREFAKTARDTHHMLKLDQCTAYLIQNPAPTTHVVNLYNLCLWLINNTRFFPAKLIQLHRASFLRIH